MHVAAVIDWNSGDQTMFVHTDSLSKNSNSIATMVYECVRAIKTSGTEAAQAPELIIQSDGGSENAYVLFSFFWLCNLCFLCSNITLASLLTDLVARGIYKRCYHYRMVVGHTHSQVDQASFVVCLRPQLMLPCL